MSSLLTQRIESALRRVVHVRSGLDVIAADVVRDVGTTPAGRVRLTVLLAPDDDATIVRSVRLALEAVEGVTDVRVDVRDPAEFDRPAAAATPRPAARQPLPVMSPAAPAPKRVAAPTPVAYPALGRVIAVSSGKGGVGKSTVAVNLAVALARSGARVGLMDADIYGPNIPRMMGVSEPPPVMDDKILPLEAHGVKVISLGLLIDRDQPAIWRGPIVMKIITQFLRDVNWGQLDVLLVDMPPGTGDAQLSLVQATNVAGAVIVTTPQDVSTGDALRGAKMFQRVNVPVLGIIENMSWFECPHCGEPSTIFGAGGGQRLADELDLPLLGQVPLYPRVLAGGDSGEPIVVAEPESGAAQALTGIAERVREMAVAPTV
jgi:ATP-binding protein involved in chromosome partitioning